MSLSFCVVAFSFHLLAFFKGPYVCVFFLARFKCVLRVGACVCVVFFSNGVPSTIPVALIVLCEMPFDAEGKNKQPINLWLRWAFEIVVIHRPRPRQISQHSLPEPKPEPQLPRMQNFFMEKYIWLQVSQLVDTKTKHDLSNKKEWMYGWLSWAGEEMHGRHRIVIWDCQWASAGSFQPVESLVFAPICHRWKRLNERHIRE